MSQCLISLFHTGRHCAVWQKSYLLIACKMLVVLFYFAIAESQQAMQALGWSYKFYATQKHLRLLAQLWHTLGVGTLACIIFIVTPGCRIEYSTGLRTGW